MARWTYADADVQARVETIRRGDRIYLPRGGGRVVSSVTVYDDGQVVVAYFTGERAKPLQPRWRPDDESGQLVATSERSNERRELVQAQLRPYPSGTRLRVRRCVQVST